MASLDWSVHGRDDDAVLRVATEKFGNDLQPRLLDRMISVLPASSPHP